MVVGRMQALYAIGAALICILSRRTAAHPLCYYDDRPTDPDMVMIFCPPQEEGACCNEAEEMAAITLYNEASATTLTDECAELYRQVSMEIMHSSCTTCNRRSCGQVSQRFRVMGVFQQFENQSYNFYESECLCALRFIHSPLVFRPQLTSESTDFILFAGYKVRSRKI